MRIRVPEKRLCQQDLVLRVIHRAGIIEDIRLDGIANEEVNSNNRN